MQPIDPDLVSVGDLVSALQEEAAYQRTWLPPEPWWSPLLANAEDLCTAIHRRLARGTQWPRSQIVSVRKPGHGIRPVALIDPRARIVYRTLAAKVVPVDQRPERSAEAYADFVVRPIREGFPSEPGLRVLGDSEFSHIVVADLAAFYQYVDHAILGDELDASGAEIGAVDALVGLLGDIEGRHFGIPQRSSPSDWLGDLCAQRIERSAARAGLRLWRYSDDFRIGVSSWEQALHAIEALSDAARDVGVVLNEHKLRTPRFIDYWIHNVDSDVNDASAEIDPEDIEAAVTTDYAPDDDDQAIAEAAETLKRLYVKRPKADGWDLADLSGDQNVAVRRALNTLTKHKDDAGIKRAYDVIKFQPSLMHRVVRYIEAIAESDPQVVRVLDRCARDLSMNEWQCAWLAYGYRATNAPMRETSSRTGWLRSQMSRWRSLGAAEAAVTLAEHALIDFDTLDARLASGPDDLRAWYLSAMSSLSQSNSADRNRLNAVRQSSELAKAIIA